MMLMWLTITHYTLYVPGHEFVCPIGLDKMSIHMMGYETMIKVLFTYIPTDQLAKPHLIMSHLVIFGPYPIIPNVPE